MKAVVLETRGKEAAVLVRDGTVRIAHGSYSVGDIIELNEAPRPFLRYWAAAAATIVVGIGITTGLWIDRNYVTYAEVSLDVNPSIVYSVNKRDRVLSVQSVNEDAETIVEKLKQDSIRFAPLSDSVEKTMEVLEGEGYLSQDIEDYVLINVSADDETRQNRLVNEAENAMTQAMERDPTMDYHIDRSDRRTAREARNSGMSTGRYAAWQEARKEKGDSDELPKEDYATKPVREIMGKAGAEPEIQADAADPPEGANQQAGKTQRPEDNAAQRPEDSESQRPQDGAAQRPENNELQRPEDSESQHPEDNAVQRPQDSVPQHNDAKDSPTNQTKSSDAPGTGADNGNLSEEDRSADGDKPSGKDDQGNEKKQGGSGGSFDRKKQNASDNPSGDRKSESSGGSSGRKKQNPQGNSAGDRKTGSSGGKKDGSPSGNGKTDSRHK